MIQSSLTSHPQRASRFGPPLPIKTLIGFLIAIAAIAIVARLSYIALKDTERSAQRVTNTLEVTAQLQTILSTMKDAETGQRGFMLTDDGRYLGPYLYAKATLAADIAAARALVADDPEQRRRLYVLEQRCADKMAELARTIELRRQGGAAEALAIVRTNHGNELMERIRAITAQMAAEERPMLATHQAEWLGATRFSSSVTVGGAAFLLALIAALAIRMSREYRARRIRIWVRDGQIALSERILGEQRLQNLCDRTLGFLAEYLDVQVGAIYLAEPDGTFRRFASYAIAGRPELDLVCPGDGLLGQAAKENRALHPQDVPESYLSGRSDPAGIKPIERFVAPASVGGVAYAVIELTFSRRLEAADNAFLERALESLGVAVRSSKDRTRLEEVLDAAQRQGEELQIQQDAMRVKSEDLNTARKRAEGDLLNAGALERAIFNSANFSKIATDANGVIQIFNVGAERMLGYTAEEVMNKITPADISDPQEIIARAKALSIELETPIAPGFEALVFKASRGIEDIYELTYIRKDGSRFPAVVSVTALRDAEGAIIGYLLIGTDNTARKRAEEALLKAGALQSAIFNSANFSSIATDSNGVIQIFNVGAERMLGYTAEEVMNKITPADISDPQEIIARAEALSVELETPIAPGFEALVFKASRGIEDIYELTYIRKDGSRFPAVVSVTALRDAEGAIIGYLLIGTDNTARKQIEAEQMHLAQRLRDHQFYTRSLFESNIDALMTTDAPGIITDVNKQMEALTGCTRDELIGAPFKTFFTDPERAEAGISLALSKRKVTDYELTACDRNGKETVVSYNATTLYDRDRRLQGVFAAVREITERKQYERSLREATHRAEHANSAKSEFLANMSHEIRTPLNAVIGLGYLLEHTTLNVDQRQLLSKIQFGGRALLGVINNVLDLSKIEAGEMSLEDEPFDLPELVRDLGQMLTPQAVAKGIELIVQCAAAVPRIVKGDASRLRQILTNLLGNSIKFTETGHVELKVFCTEQSSDRVRLRCTVQDTGIGIEPAAIEGLFTPFTQADASTTRRFGGTGLGLSIARRFVELMGGEIGVSSTVTVGSIFWIEMPLRIAHDIDGMLSERGLRILVADSSGDVPERLLGMARALGWSPQVAETGEQLITALRTTQPHTWPDVLIVELHLDDMDAHQLIARLEKECAHGELPPVIVVADLMQSYMEQELRMRAMDVLLVRPLTSSALFNAVNAVVSKQPDSLERVLQSTNFDELHAQWLAGVHVLVVDDSDINLEVAQRILEKQGATVTTCSDGLAALQHVRVHHGVLDVVLMDVQMPTLDGNEATRRIRGELQLKTLPIVALTAGALVGERQRALEAGMNDFISKPFDPQALIRKVRRLVEGARGEPIAMVILDTEPTSNATRRPLMSSIDAGVVQQMFGDDLPLFKSLLARMLREFADLALPTAVSSDDQTTLSEIKARTHKLKGSAGMIGATKVMRLAGAAEVALQECRPADIIEGILTQLASALTTLREEAELFLAVPEQSVDSNAAMASRPNIGNADINGLCALLESQNLAAIDRFCVLSPSLSELVGAVRFDRLRDAIDNLDFHLGAELLREAL
jgi:PAS domain S-box-containing protein